MRVLVACAARCHGPCPRNNSPTGTAVVVNPAGGVEVLIGVVPVQVSVTV